MLSVVNQIKRMYNDKGQNDKSFYEQEAKLKAAQTKLKEATENVIRAAQRLSYILREDRSELH